MLSSETSACVVTPAGRGGISVIVMRGPKSSRVLEKIFRPVKSHKNAPPGALQLGSIIDNGREIDQAIVSRNGETIEINIHGGPVVTRKTIELLAEGGVTIVPPDDPRAGGFNLAHPRWNNPAVGAEMLQSLVQAKSGFVVSVISNQWSSGLSRLAAQTIEKLSGDTSNLPSDLADNLVRAASALPKSTKLLNPPQVVLAGPPNVGKSTLTNALAGRQVSIVHDTPGTTRDWVRELAILDGIAVFLTDTAGLFDSAQGIEAQAVARAEKCARDGDLVLLVTGESPLDVPPWLADNNLLRVANKCDICKHQPCEQYDVKISAATGQGMDKLRRAILKSLDLADIDPETPTAFTARQANLLTKSANQITAKQFKAARGTLAELLEGTDIR